jgi:hypothetical protein
MGAALVLPIALFAMAAPASAKEPTGNFAVYKQCPTNDPAVNLCIDTNTTGGEFEVGKISVPIVKTQTLQFGSVLSEETGLETVVDAENGETLVKTPQVVPGGIFSLIKEGRYPWYLRNFCKNFPSNSECKVTSTAELVGQPTLSRTNLLSAEGTAVGLPIRLHLKNPFLGSRCFIGSATSPLQLNYTTGTTSPPPPNTPIAGAVGEIEFTNEFTNIIVKNDLVVNNEFSAPGAEGCGGPQSLIVDEEIDQKNALPSPAGHNTSKLSGMLFNATAEGVTNSEA